MISYKSVPIYTTNIDTRDCALKILMKYQRKERNITSTDIPTDVIAIRHPSFEKNIWLVFNKNKKLLFQVDTNLNSIKSLDYKDINNYIK